MWLRRRPELFWGLRDYGTATWDGGDAECDHRPPDEAGKTTKPTLLGQREHAGRFAGPQCWRCGAQRIDSQIGLEASPDAYVQQLVAVFREVRRVLRDDGTLWLNLGSSYASDPAKGGSGTFNGRNGYGESYGRSASQFRPRSHVPACGSDGTALLDSTAVDSAYSDLCDGCLGDFLSHRDRIVGSGQQIAQSERPLLPTGHDSEPMDSDAASLDASPLDVQASTMLQSWRQHRGACSRCASRASALSLVRSSSADVQACGDMSWLNYTRTLKQKDLVMIPSMVAMSLQADGWYLRSEIVWAKKNCMPESCIDRPTKSHEMIYLLTKRATYFYDADAIRESNIGGISGGRQYAQAKGLALEKRNPNGQPNGQGHNMYGLDNPNGRNKRSVWHVATQSYDGAHFATFPEALIEPCILAGTSEKGCCPSCGAPWARLTDERVEGERKVCPKDEVSQLARGASVGDTSPRLHTRLHSQYFKVTQISVTWQPTCRCTRLDNSSTDGAILDSGSSLYEPVPCTVLDPFCGSGTTGAVAIRHQRNFIGVELNQSYVELARRRIGAVAPLFASEVRDEEVA